MGFPDQVADGLQLRILRLQADKTPVLASTLLAHGAFRWSE